MFDQLNKMPQGITRAPAPFLQPKLKRKRKVKKQNLYLNLQFKNNFSETKEHLNLNFERECSNWEKVIQADEFQDMPQ